MNKYKCLVGTTALTKGKYYHGRVARRRDRTWKWTRSVIVIPVNDNGKESVIAAEKMLRIVKN